MRKMSLLSATALRSALFIGATSAFALPAAAQTAQPAVDPAAQAAQEAACDTKNPTYNIATGTCVETPTSADGSANAPATEASASSGQEVVVTGSRIRRPNLESTVPITSIVGESFFQQSNSNIGDSLNELPQLRSTFNQTNPGAGIGIAGLNLLDLRGLGTSRTLVLVNGRRHVPADILNNAVSPDVNTIPNDLIERVDIVTGGNSAIYGSDAIAGVVNFVLRRDFTGVQLRASGATTEAGFGKNFYVSGMAGQNFFDGRANLTVHGEYSEQERVFFSDIPFLRQNNAFATVDIDPAGLPENSDGNPDAIFVRDIRSATINRNGIVYVQQPTAAPCGTGISNGVTPGTPYTCNFLFTGDGRLSQQTGARIGTGPNGVFLGGNGQTGRENELQSVIPFLQRYNFNLLGHFEITPAFEPFIEAKWNRVNSSGSNLGPSFTQGTRAQFDFREDPRLDNPFLNPADRTTLAAAILASGFNTNISTRAPLTAAQTTAIGNGSYRFKLGKQFEDIGKRDETFQRDTYRVVTGIRGVFNDDWSYEASINYGKFKERVKTEGFLDRQRFMLAYDAVLDPNTNTIKCRSQIDPAARVVGPGPLALNQDRLAADVAACVPYNPFGSTADNSASIDYFSVTGGAKNSLTQFVGSAFVSGDSSQLFELPGGPVRFAVGGEYRKEKAIYDQADVLTSGITNGVSIPRFAPPAFKVKEAFGEIQIPILKDIPYFQELTISGAARVAKYQGGTGTVWSYNTGVDYSPIGGLRLRGNYGRAVRAPNVSETGFPLVPNFANGFTDPCNPVAISQGTSFRQANCAAQFTALGFANPLTNRAYSLKVLSGSNPNLISETSDSITLGFVAQPKFIPGLSVSADFYNIKVNKVISSIAAQTIVNLCVDLPTLSNPYCDLFQRYAGPGVNSEGDNPGDILSNTTLQAPLNFARLVRRGIDTQISYRRELFSGLRFDGTLIWTHNLKNSNFLNAVDPTFENRILGELGDPRDEFRLDTDWTYGDFTFGYRLQYIGSMVTSSYEAFNSLQGRPPENSDTVAVEKYPVVTYSDVRLEWRPKNLFGKEFRLYGGVDNIFDKRPPFGLTGVGAGSAIYDVRGRSYYLGTRIRF